MGNLVRATNLWGYSDLVRELGGNPGEFLQRFRIPDGIEYQEDAFVSVGGFLRMLEATAEDLDCPNFGLRLSRWQGLDVLGPIAVIARNAQTLLAGLDAIARYMYFHSPAGKLTVAQSSSTEYLDFTVELTEPAVRDIRQGYELSLANGARMIQLLGGPDARPSVISFMHSQLGPDAAYAEALGCPVRFGQPRCGFEVARALADRPIVSADAETRRIATKYLESQYLSTTAPLSERVSDVARRLLPTGHCTPKAIAEHLAMHPRTMQRRLETEGLRCKDLLDWERRVLAAKYLSEPALELGQIAGLLGYTEQSTFNRAFRRWFDTTPRQYRAGMAQ